MRQLIFLLCYVLSNVVSGQPFFETADRFFKQYVKDGLIRYDEIKRDRSELDLLVEEIGNYTLRGVSDQEEKAFYINAYNLIVIRHIIDRFPVEGPLSVPGFFDRLTARVAGTSMTLDQLEKERLLNSYPDARLHFVLVCAAKGCPPLANFSFKPDDLEDQLEERTVYVLNFQPFIAVDKVSIEVSKIFEWYQKDFIREKGSVLEYINHFHRQDLEGKTLVFYDYDWSLNKY